VVPCLSEGLLDVALSLAYMHVPLLNRHAMQLPCEPPAHLALSLSSFAAGVRPSMTNTGRQP